MKIRKFKAANSHLGLQVIREALGDDASILACYEVADGVEFVVTADDLSAIVNSKGQPVQTPATERASAIASAITPAEQIARRQENLRHLGLAGDAQRQDSNAVTASISSQGSSADILMRNTRSSSVEASLKAASALATSRVKPMQAAAEAPASSVRAVSTPVAIPTKAPDASMPAEMLALKQELGSIRHWLENHLRQTNLPSHSAVPVQLSQWADALGLDNHWLLAKPAIMDAMNLGFSAAEAISKSLASGLSASQLPRSGVVFVVGPAGAGKTTLVNKLVMSDIRRHGHGGLTLITTDGNRLGAQEQLRAAGRVLDVPVHSAFTPDDLRDTLARLSHERLVIIDTAGLQARHEASLKTLALQLSCAPHAEVLLALPTDADPRSLRALMSRCAGLPISAVAMTRVDMSYAIAPTLSLISDYALPVAAINQSPRMTDGIDAASNDIDGLIALAMVQADELINQPTTVTDQALTA